MLSEPLELRSKCFDVVGLPSRHVDSGSILLIELLVFVALHVLRDILSANLYGWVCSWPIKTLQKKFLVE